MTKLLVQVPISLAISQVALYTTNTLGGAETLTDAFSVLSVNSLLPLLILCVAGSLVSSRTDAFLSKIAQANNIIELKSILKSVPQAIFLIEDATDEVLFQSDEVEAQFEQRAELMLQDPIFEVKAPRKAFSQQTLPKFSKEEAADLETARSSQYLLSRRPSISDGNGMKSTIPSLSSKLQPQPQF